MMNQPRQKDRAFGFMFALVFVIIASVAWVAFDTKLYWAIVLALVFLVLARTIPRVLMPFNRLWGAFARRLGHINNHLVLGLFFVLFVFPAALIIRLFGHDPLHRKFEKNAPTYLMPVKRHTNTETLADMF